VCPVHPIIHVISQLRCRRCRATALFRGPWSSAVSLQQHSSRGSDATIDDYGMTFIMMETVVYIGLIITAHMARGLQVVDSSKLRHLYHVFSASELHGSRLDLRMGRVGSWCIGSVCSLSYLCYLSCSHAIIMCQTYTYTAINPLDYS